MLLAVLLRRREVPVTAPHVYGSDDGHRFEPWADGRSVGFKITDPAGTVAYVTLTPPLYGSALLVMTGSTPNTMPDFSAGYIEPFADVDAPEYPREHAGATVWACCVSAVGPACGHREVPA